MSCSSVKILIHPPRERFHSSSEHLILPQPVLLRHSFSRLLTRRILIRIFISDKYAFNLERRPFKGQKLKVCRRAADENGATTRCRQTAQTDSDDADSFSASSSLLPVCLLLFSSNSHWNCAFDFCLGSLPRSSFLVLHLFLFVYRLRSCITTLIPHIYIANSVPIWMSFCALSRYILLLNPIH